MISQDIAHIYIDENGTPDLDVTKSGVQPYFIYAAVIIPNVELEKARKIHQTILNANFQNSFIKSAHIGNDKSGFAKYVDSFSKLNELRHHVVALIVDKTKISKTSGLSYKQVFIKYFQRLLSRTFLNNFQEFHIVADKTGSQEFEESLERYLAEKGGIEPTLFSNNTFELAEDTKGEVLLQFADLYAGALGRYYCNCTEENRAKTVHDIIRSRISIEWYPENCVPAIVATDSFSSSFDPGLLSLSMRTAEEYIENHPDEICNNELLQYLLQESRIRPLRHISSKEIKAFLNGKNIEIGDPIERVSALRDEGVIIISPIGKKGYKFPTSKQELAEFYNRLSSNIIPQIRRGYKLSQVLSIRGYDRYNVLNDPEFHTLKNLSDIVNKQY